METEGPRAGLTANHLGGCRLGGLGWDIILRLAYIKQLREDCSLALVHAVLS